MTKHLSVDRAKRVSRECRNHGSCPYCRRSRTRNLARREQAAREEVAEFVRYPTPSGDCVECQHCFNAWPVPSSPWRYCPSCGREIGDTVEE